ncbi:uncharacterized protein [Primulina huaijiensis]|uniref:uncharacterized protein isoform X1 n=1 Tax=Primulina huaijiensis TaxID=1492673 RepID=UPI003CC706F2
MMSTSRRSSGGSGVQSIPDGSRKMVQSLKEIVSCPETEIYAALKDCNMDPNEAVNRLLSQDPFHEVKSKREKKKEGKDTTESRPRGTNNSSNRSGKNAVDRYLGRGSSALYSSYESVPIHGKVADKKEDGSTLHMSYLSSAPVVVGNNKSSGPPGLSGVSIDSEPSDTQLSSGLQTAWSGVPNQLSMADIVKMGRPHNQAPSAPNASHYNMNDQNVQGPTTAALHQNLRFSEDQVSDVHDSRVSLAQQVPTNNDWPTIEKPVPKNILSLPEYHVDSELQSEPYDASVNSISQQFESEEVQDAEDVVNPGANDVGSASISGRLIQEDESGAASIFENDSRENTGSFQHQVRDFEHHEDEPGASVSSVSRNMEQLNIKDGRGLPSERDGPSVIIPKHLLVQNVDCSHLSFGSFGSGISAAHSSGPMTSVPLKISLEKTHGEADLSTVGYTDSRNTVYFVDDSIRNTSDGNLFHTPGVSSGSYDASSASQPEDLKPEHAEVADGNQYLFQAPNPDYTYNEVQQLNAAFSQSQTSSQMQTLTPFSNVMQSYTTPLPSTLLASNVPSSRESDLRFLPFSMAQSLSAKYGSSVSSIGGSAISMSEALKTAGFSSMQSSPQAISGTNVAAGPPLPQHLTMNPYSQPSLPLGPFTNMISYPFLPQSYAYMPSAFQQAFPGNSTYHQSLAGVLPQYKNSISVSSLPQSSTIASGYAAFGNSTAIPGNFQMNPPSVPSGATLSYDDALGSQYKDNNRPISLQQNDNSTSWLHGLNSRTMSAVPANTFYNYPGQNQQSGGYGQSQQPPQNYGTPGYPNFYHPQTVASLDQQQQNPREGSLGSSQGQPNLSQIWQNGY